MDPISLRLNTEIGKDEIVHNVFPLLPIELTENIVSYFSISSLVHGCRTCHEWNFALNLKDNPNLWKSLIFQQDECCSKLWNRYLGDCQLDPRWHDPELHHKRLIHIGFSIELEEVIRTIIIEKCSPLTKPLKNHFIQTIKSVLISGPTDNGKTFSAHKIPKLLNCHWQQSHTLNASKIFDDWRGMSKANIDEIFTTIFTSAKKPIHQNKNFLLVIDDIDVILSRDFKESGDLWTHSIVESFLTQMEELKKMNNIIVIGLTNQLKKIDEASIKAFDKHIETKALDQEARKK